MVNGKVQFKKEIVISGGTALINIPKVYKRYLKLKKGDIVDIIIEKNSNGK